VATDQSNVLGLGTVRPSSPFSFRSSVPRIAWRLEFFCDQPRRTTLCKRPHSERGEKSGMFDQRLSSAHGS
jgi:hypothetical protein